VFSTLARLRGLRLSWTKVTGPTGRRHRDDRGLACGARTAGNCWTSPMTSGPAFGGPHKAPRRGRKRFLEACGLTAGVGWTSGRNKVGPFRCRFKLQSPSCTRTRGCRLDRFHHRRAQQAANFPGKSAGDRRSVAISVANGNNRWPGGWSAAPSSRVSGSFRMGRMLRALIITSCMEFRPTSPEAPMAATRAVGHRSGSAT